VTDDNTAAADSSAELAAPFIQRWAASGAAERANCQSFLSELCDLIGVPRPEPTKPDVAENACVFERDVTFQNPDGSTSIGRIDLYKRGCFVLEAKQGSEQTTDDPDFALSAGPKKKTKRGTAVRGTKGCRLDAMVRARGQAEQYARALPHDEGWPPFLIVVDVGHSIELFTDFSRTGKTHLPFPDPGSFRIRLEQLADEQRRETLKTVWTDPVSLDPSRRSAPCCDFWGHARAGRSAGDAREVAGAVGVRSVPRFSVPDAVSVHDVRRRRRTDCGQLLCRLALEPARGHSQLPGHGAVTVADDGHGRVLADPADEAPEVQRRALRGMRGAAAERSATRTADRSGSLELAGGRAGDLREVAGTSTRPSRTSQVGRPQPPRCGETYAERLVIPTIIDLLLDERDAVRTALAKW